MENQDLLNREKEEILTKVAVLLEADNYETSFLAIKKAEETYLLIATNRPDESARKTLEKILQLIKKESLKAEDWWYFNRICRRYIHANTKQSINEKIWVGLFDKISAYFKVETFDCTPSVFYCHLKLAIEKSTELIVEYFKDCLTKGIKPQNISTMVQFAQHLVSNLYTVRYYYHWDKQKKEDEVAEFIFRKVHLIDNVKFVKPLDEIFRHAEMSLVDAVVNDGSIMDMELFNSKKVCLDCHAFLLLFNQASVVPIKFSGAHDLAFDNWNWPRQMDIISRGYHYQVGKFESDLKHMIRIIDDEVPIDRKAAEMGPKHRSMFPLPLVIQKALNISEDIPF